MDRMYCTYYSVMQSTVFKETLVVPRAGTLWFQVQTGKMGDEDRQQEEGGNKAEDLLTVLLCGTSPRTVQAR